MIGKPERELFRKSQQWLVLEATVLTSLTFLGLSIGQKQQQQQRNTRLTTSFMLGRSNKKVLLNQSGQSIV